MPLESIDFAEILRMLRASSLEDMQLALGKACQAQSARMRGTDVDLWLLGQDICNDAADMARDAGLSTPPDRPSPPQ